MVEYSQVSPVSCAPPPAKPTTPSGRVAVGSSSCPSLVSYSSAHRSAADMTPKEQEKKLQVNANDNNFFYYKNRMD